MKKAHWFLSILIIFIIGALVISPDIYLSACLQGILVWATVVLPAIFPFLFFTKLLTDLGIVNIIASKFTLFTKLFKTPPISAYVFLMSIISGYPVGSKIVSDLYENKSISKEDAFKMTTFTSNSGPMFILGSVGIGMLFSRTLGLIMLFSHIGSAVLNGLLYRNHKEKTNIKTFNLNDKKFEKDFLNTNMNYNSDFGVFLYNTYRFEDFDNKFFNKENRQIDNNVSAFKIQENKNNNRRYVFKIGDKNSSNIQSTRNNLDEKISKNTIKIKTSTQSTSYQFAQSMWNSISSILIIGGFISIFFVLIEMLNHLNIISSFTSFLSTVFGGDSRVYAGIFNGVVEMTYGCLDISKISLSEFWATLICCGIITFGGISTMLQAIIFLQKFNMRPGFFLKQKVTQTMFSILICAVLLLLFNF
ncbi:MAG: hypothetical protein PHH71_01375 [Clostridia bacterium]|nr:hypothetical protein [Clostridia bacterium]MDD3862614.1 hypothetical protein [Clostridia bacterium]